MAILGRSQGGLSAAWDRRRVRSAVRAEKVQAKQQRNKAFFSSGQMKFL
jgi:hypothetical protein